MRDALLGNPAADLDIEVFGIPPDRLTELVRTVVPVRLVGASFGVLKAHGLPIDVSLPRRERKVGPGHRGFEIDADPYLDDRSAAARRDFTINAIAWDPLAGRLIDPFDGRQDLERRILRHTSDQFDEDPLRVLRGMHFVARFELTASTGDDRPLPPHRTGGPRRRADLRRVAEAPAPGGGDLVGTGVPARGRLVGALPGAGRAGRLPAGPRVAPRG